MLRRAFLQLLAASPLAALAAWRPPALPLPPWGIHEGNVGVDVGRGPSSCVFTVRGPGYVQCVPVHFVRDPKYVRVSIGAQAVTFQARGDERSEWVSVAQLPVTGFFAPMQVSVDEVYPHRLNRWRMFQS